MEPATAMVGSPTASCMGVETGPAAGWLSPAVRVAAAASVAAFAKAGNAEAPVRSTGTKCNGVLSC